MASLLTAALALFSIVLNFVQPLPTIFIDTQLRDEREARQEVNFKGCVYATRAQERTKIDLPKNTAQTTRRE